MAEWLVKLTIPSGVSIPELDIVSGVGLYVTGRNIGTITDEDTVTTYNASEGFLTDGAVDGVGGRIDIVSGGGFGALNVARVNFDNTIGWASWLLTYDVVIASAVIQVFRVIGGIAYSRYVGNVEGATTLPAVYSISFRGANEREYRNIPEVDKQVFEAGDVEYIPLGDPMEVTGQEYRLMPKRYYEQIINDQPVATLELFISYLDYFKAGSADNPRPFRNKWVQIDEIGGASVGGAYIVDHTPAIEYSVGIGNPEVIYYIEAKLDRVITNLTSDMMDINPNVILDASKTPFPGFANFGEYTVKIQSKERVYQIPDESGLEKDPSGNVIVYYKTSDGGFENTGVTSNLVNGNLTIPDEDGRVQYSLIPALTGSSFKGYTEIVGDAQPIDDAPVFKAEYAGLQRRVDLIYKFGADFDFSQFDSVMLSWQMTYRYSTQTVGGNTTWYDGLLPSISSSVQCGFEWLQYEEIDNPWTFYTEAPRPNVLRARPCADIPVPVYSDGVPNALGDIWKYGFLTTSPLESPFHNNKPINFSPFPYVTHRVFYKGIVFEVSQEAGGFPAVSKVATEEYVGTAYDSSGVAEVRTDIAKNGTLYYSFGIDGVLDGLRREGSPLRFYYSMNRVSLVGVKQIQYGDLYVRRVSGSGTGGDVQSIPEFVAALFQYNGIPYGTDYASRRDHWKCGAIISKKESTKKILQEIAQQAFVGLFQTRLGSMSMVPFREQAEVPLYHTEKTISEVISVGQTPATDLVNDITLQYAYDWASGSYDRQYYVTNLTAAEFPAYGDDYSEFSNIPSYPDAKAFWDSAKGSFNDNGGLRIARGTVTDCRFYQGSSSVMNTSVHFYLTELVEWATRQKNIITYSVPVTPDNMAIDYLQKVQFSHRIYTGGQIVTGYIDQISDQEETITLRIMTEPVSLVPVYDIIDEDTVNDSYIDEDTENDNRIEEDF